MLNFDEVAGGGKVTNLSGKERGIAARAEFKLDALDDVAGTIEIVVPEYVDTISPSYFQGLFSISILKLKGRENFLNKYHFQASPQVMEWVELGIRNATSSRKPLI